MGLGTQFKEINLIVLNISAFVQNQLNPRPRIFKEGIRLGSMQISYTNYEIIQLL